MAKIRKIIHLDLDAFFCAVEEQRDPSLKGKAFAVGARPEERGVVASCSYPARKFGIHSAMPMGQALRLCPKLIIVSRRHSAYEQVSKDVMARLYALTPLVERVSIDEAFLDVTANPEPAESLARQLQKTINEELNLPCSLGASTNKLVAKIANNIGKAAVRSNSPPNAIQVVPPGEEAAFLAPMPILALWGVGPKTAARLEGLGIRTIGDLARYPEKDLVRRFGKHGRDLSLHARGIDEEPIETIREAKSISKETTFVHDISDKDILEGTLLHLSEGVGHELRQEGLTCQTVGLKYRREDFTTLTRQSTLNEPTDLDRQIFDAVKQLFGQVWKPGDMVRLLGVSASRLQGDATQLTLWDNGAEKKRKIQNAVDAIRGKFGEKSVRWAKETRRGES